MSVILNKEYTPAINSLEVRNRVLRNTYWLLALSMIPTALGAVVGVQFQVPVLSGFLGFMVFMAIAFGFFWAIEKNKNSGVGVALLLAFTFFMGLMMTPLLTRTLGYSNGGTLIMTAFGGTAAVLAVMAIGIFSAFILYDVQRIVNGGETNYVTATLGLYLNVYNIFSAMLSLLGLGGDRD